MLLKKEPISIKSYYAYTNLQPYEAQAWPTIFQISKRISKKQTEEIQMSSWIINRVFTLILLNFPVYEFDLSQLDIALSYHSQNLLLPDVQVTCL